MLGLLHDVGHITCCWAYYMLLGILHDVRHVTCWAYYMMLGILHVGDITCWAYYMLLGILHVGHITCFGNITEAIQIVFDEGVLRRIPAFEAEKITKRPCSLF
jgi:hypothetical protein